MKGFYKLKEDKRFQIGVSTFGMCKGSQVEVKQVDAEYKKVLIDFGAGFIDWMPNSILSNFDAV